MALESHESALTGRGADHRVLFSAPVAHVTAVTSSFDRLFAVLAVLSGNLINSGAFGSFSTSVSMATWIKTSLDLTKPGPEHLNSLNGHFKDLWRSSMQPQTGWKKVTHNAILQRGRRLWGSQTPASALLNAKRLPSSAPPYFSIWANWLKLSLLTASTHVNNPLLPQQF